MPITNNNGEDANAKKASNSLKRRWNVMESISFNNMIIKLAPNNHSKFHCARLFCNDDGTFPNNPHHPVIFVQHAFGGTSQQGRAQITLGNAWTLPWVWGIFPYHHYHSTAWELLLCVSGHAPIQLGGPTGPPTTIQRGDLVLIPPGVAHKQLTATHDFNLLGSYPTFGCSGSVDTVRGAPTDQQRATIQACVAPTTEPILGLDLSHFYQE